MDYKRIYDQLIERARERIPNGYVERHHVIPRCMGGNDEKENLVALYPEEHFVAHALLLKIYKETEHRYALAHAMGMMCSSGETHKRIRRKLYGWLKREHALAMSETQKGSGNSQYGTMWICHNESKQNKKIPKDQPVPDGWVKGRIKTWRSPVLVEKVYSFCSCGSRLSNSKSGLCKRCFWSSELGSENAKRRTKKLKEKDPLAFSEKQRNNIKKRYAGMSERLKETAFQADE